MFSRYAVIGACAAFLSVALGAFAAHSLKASLSADDLAVFETGVRYEMYHAIGILLIALFGDRWHRPRFARWAAGLLTAGIVLFSGSLYALALSGIKPLGAITPVGGVAFLAGWLCLAGAAAKRK
jgi:uncharacterized membrane protein YgdD (TMEM256/DUF423 family)